MKGMRKIKSKEGFTLVELSLSIAFIAILSITIALITNDAISTYRRGVVLNQVNTVGMDLVDDIRAVVQGSPSTAVTEECEVYSGSGNSDTRKKCEDSGAQLFVVFSKKAKVIDKTAGIAGEALVGEDVPVYGAFCTGSYSYVWNSGYFYDTDDYRIENVDRVKLKYKGGEEDNFRLLKIKDQQRAVCKAAIAGGKYETVANIDGDTIDISEYNNSGEEPEILLANDINNPLALYDLSAAAPAASSANVEDNGEGALFYSISFILGTVQGGINVMSTGNFCNTPTDYNSNFDYCAINKFNFAAQATGG